MRLILLTQALPTPTDGGLLVPYHLALRLARRHQVEVVSVRTKGDREADRVRLTEAGVRLVEVEPDPEGGWAGRVARFLSPLPGIVALHDHRSLRAALASRVAATGPDAVLGFMCNMAPALTAQPAPVRILVPYDAESQLARRAGQARTGPLGRLAGALHAWKYARLERVYYPGFSAVVVVGARDRDWLAESAPGARIELIPNGVDREYFSAPVDPVRLDPPPAGPAVVLTGTLNVPSTVDAVVWYLQEVHPRVRARVPGCEFWVVGRSPAPALRALSGEPGVRMPGLVPDIRPWLAGASVSVAPFRFGGGMKNKVLEALSAGLPVVATPEGVAGFEGDPAEPIAVAGDPETFAARVVERLLRAPDRAGVLAAARRSILDRHDWEACAGRYERLVEDCLARGRG